MGKKYIFEVEDETQLIVEIGVNSTGAAVITTKHPKYLTQYEEPDLDAIRKEAYKDGREAGIKDGMCEAWEAARKIVHLQWDGAWAGVDEVEKWFDTYTASEAIEKTRQYEQEIQVGDEVIGIYSSGEQTMPFVITKGNRDYYFGIYSHSGEFCQGG